MATSTAVQMMQIAATYAGHSHDHGNAQSLMVAVQDSAPIPSLQKPKHDTVFANPLPQGAQSMTNLFVNGLPLDFNQANLSVLFEPFGEIISCAVMRNIHTGESLGNGFVRYQEAVSAAEALAKMTGQKIGEHTLSVQYAKKQHDNAPIGEARLLIKKLFVRNVPLDVTQADLSAIFGRFGALRKITLHKDTVKVKDKSLVRRIAFVIFAGEGSAAAAVDQIHNTLPFEGCNGVPLMVKLADDHQQSHSSNRTNGGNNAQSGRNAAAQRRPSLSSYSLPPPAYVETQTAGALTNNVSDFPVEAQSPPPCSLASPQSATKPTAIVELSVALLSGGCTNLSSTPSTCRAEAAERAALLATPSSSTTSLRPQPPVPAGSLSPECPQLSFHPDDAASTPRMESRPLSRASSQSASAFVRLHPRARVSISLSPQMLDVDARGGVSPVIHWPHRGSAGTPSYSNSESSFATTPTGAANGEAFFRETCAPAQYMLSTNSRSSCVSPISSSAKATDMQCNTGGRGFHSASLIDFFDDAPVELNLSRTHTPRSVMVPTPTTRYRHNPYNSSTSRVACGTPASTA